MNNQNKTKLKNLELLRGKHIDPGKIVVKTNRTNITGKELFDILRDRYKLELEMKTPTFVIAMTSLADDREGLLRLSEALMDIDKELRLSKKNMSYYLPRPDVSMTIRQAEEKGEKDGYLKKNLSESLGYISFEYLYIYPPGTPIIAPGEVITKEVLDVIKSCKESVIKVLGLSLDGRIKVIGKEK